MKYWIQRLRSWWYWRQFDSPGKDAMSQSIFARDNLNDGVLKGLWR